MTMTDTQAMAAEARETALEARQIAADARKLAEHLAAIIEAHHAEIELLVRSLCARLMTVEQVADLLAVGKSTVWLLVEQGELHRVTPYGKATRFRSDEIAAFIERHTELAAS